MRRTHVRIHGEGHKTNGWAHVGVGTASAVPSLAGTWCQRCEGQRGCRGYTGVYGISPATRCKLAGIPVAPSKYGHTGVGSMGKSGQSASGRVFLILTRASVRIQLSTLKYKFVSLPLPKYCILRTEIFADASRTRRNAYMLHTTVVNVSLMSHPILSRA